MGWHFCFLVFHSAVITHVDPQPAVHGPDSVTFLADFSPLIRIGVDRSTTLGLWLPTMSKPKAKLDPAGTFSAPPAGAPHESSQPLDAAAIRAQLAKAQSNERELEPLKYQGGKPLPAKDVTSQAVEGQVPQAPEVAQVPESQGGAEAPPPEGVVAGAEGDTGLTGLAEEFNGPATQVSSVPTPRQSLAPRRPAESNSDSPSRGQPKPIGDPGKTITGGWGTEPGGQYFGLDGSELAKVVHALMADLQHQMTGDLRFGISTVYPQVRVKVMVMVDGITPDATVSEQAFDLTQSRLLELTSEVQDDQDTPADALRDLAGVSKPRKQIIQAGATSIMVDVPHVPAGQ